MVLYKNCKLSAAIIMICIPQFVACSDITGKNSLPSYILAAGSYDAGNISLAKDLAEKILAVDPAFIPALVLAGKTAFFLGDDDASIRHFEDALRLIPRAGEPALWLARSYRASGRMEDAKDMTRKLLSSDPDCIPALRLSASISLEMEDTVTALAFLDKALEAAMECGLAFVDRAAIRWAGGNASGAIADLEAALTILPVDSEASLAAQDVIERIKVSLDGR